MDLSNDLRQVLISFLRSPSANARHVMICRILPLLNDLLGAAEAVPQSADEHAIERRPTEHPTNHDKPLSGRARRTKPPRASTSRSPITKRVERRRRPRLTNSTGVRRSPRLNQQAESTCYNIGRAASYTGSKSLTRPSSRYHTCSTLPSWRRQTIAVTSSA